MTSTLSNPLLDASENVDIAQNALKKLICEMTEVKAFRGTLFARAFSLAARIQGGLSPNDALKEVGYVIFLMKQNLIVIGNFVWNFEKQQVMCFVLRIAWLLKIADGHAEPITAHINFLSKRANN
mmetsp:Transcript_16034/g.24977  ORF Transcript_16034/g.24977 Transcript_16034/m.24977 type:complete len:125 (-) Transcript_16034:417-791(-)